MQARISKLGFMLIILIFASLACTTLSGLGGNAPNPPADSGAEPPADTNAAPAPEDPAAPPPSDAAPGAETLNLDDPTLVTAIGQLSYFHTEMIYNFNGTDAAGNPVFGQVMVAGSSVLTSPAATEFTMTPSGQADLDGIGYLTFVDTEGTDYMYSPSIGCISFGDDEFDNPYEVLFDMNDALTGSAPLVESGVVVNGVVTDRYAIDDSNIDTGEPEEGEYIDINEGYVWVARDGYVVRIEITGTGASEVLTKDPTLVGTQNYSFNLTPTNEAITIAPPNVCAAGPDGVPESSYPMMDDAATVSSMETQFLTYTTQHTLDEVVIFYKTEMIAQGYALNQEFVAGPTGSLEFTKDGVMVNVLVVSGGAEGVSVVVSQIE